jgi:long-chain acyl-CoA synthetase
VVAVAGALEEPDLGLGSAWEPLACQVSEVFHVAATTKFSLPLDEARRVNVGGTSHVMRFAAQALRSGGLRRLHHVSSAYVAGRRAGIVGLGEREAGAAVGRAGAPDFRNTYERSKWEAEQLLERARGELPITRYRPSIIVGDSRSGRTLHFRVLYEPIKWVYFGKTNLLPCRPEIRVDVVPVDYVCEALLALGQQPASEGATYHLSCGPERASAISEIIELSLAIGNEIHAAEGLPPIPPPTVVSPELADAATGEAREQLRRLFEVAAGVMSAHAPYMIEEQLFDDCETRAALAGTGIACPPLREYLAVVLRYARAHNYGEP